MAAVALLTPAFIGAPARAASGRFAVPQDYPTIQAAVNAAPAGATVNVGRGTYREEVVIDKNLSVVGAGIDASVIQAPASLTSYATHLPDNRAVTAIVRVGKGAHVRMTNLTVAGPIPCGIEVSGINVFQGATLALTQSRVTGLQADPATCAADNAAGRAIVYGLPSHIVTTDGVDGSPAYGSVAQVRVDHYQHAGISIAGPDAGPRSQVSLSQNTVTGGWTLPSFQYGIEVAGAVSARLSANTVNGNVCGGGFCGPDPINEVQGVGIFVLATTGPVDVSGNALSGNDVGIYQVVSERCCRIAGNRLNQNRYFGILVQDNDGETNGNTVTGGQVGIGVVADAVDSTLISRGDRITGTTVAPVRQIECCGFTATADVR